MATHTTARRIASYRATRTRRMYRRLVKRLGCPYQNLYQGLTAAGKHGVPLAYAYTRLPEVA